MMVMQENHCLANKSATLWDHSVTYRLTWVNMPCLNASQEG